MNQKKTFDYKGADFVRASETARLRKRASGRFCQLKTVVYKGEWQDERLFTLATDRIVRAMIEGRLKGKDTGELAWHFHRMLAEAITAGCIFIRRKTSCNTVALSGGVWQNQLLLAMAVDRLRKAGFKLLIHQLIPPNDGGICLGQAAAAMHYLKKQTG